MYINFCYWTLSFFQNVSVPDHPDPAHISAYGFPFITPTKSEICECDI
jgi:hypothetical protein